MWRSTTPVVDDLRRGVDLFRTVLRDRRRRKEGYARPEDVRNCYRYLLGREPDAAGYRGYVQDLNARPTPLGELVEAFLSSEEFLERLHHVLGPEREPERIELHAGYHLYIDREDAQVGAQLRRAGAYEQKLSDRIGELCVPGAVFVDIGASIGMFSVLAGRLVGPTGHVIAIEPGPQNQALLLLNVLSNGLQDVVEIVACAASDSAVPLLYGHSGANGFIRSFEGDPGQFSRYDLVPARPLDELLADRPPADVVKIDVEGAEGRVFRGAQDLFSRATATVFFELSPPALAARSSMDAVELLAKMMDFGYRFDVVTDVGDDLLDQSVYGLLEIFSASGLEHLDVVARPRRG